MDELNNKLTEKLYDEDPYVHDLGAQYLFSDQALNVYEEAFLNHLQAIPTQLWRRENGICFDTGSGRRATTIAPFFEKALPCDLSQVQVSLCRDYCKTNRNP